MKKNFLPRPKDLSDIRYTSYRVVHEGDFSIEPLVKLSQY